MKKYVKMPFWKFCWNPVGILLDSQSPVGIDGGVISTGYSLARHTRKCLFSKFCCISHLSCGEHTGSMADVMQGKLLRVACFGSLIIEIPRFLPMCEDMGNSGVIYPHLTSDVGITLSSLP